MKFLLDSGDPAEYRELATLAKEKGGVLWGSTTNPTLIAKKLSGKKVSQKEAFALQKEIVLEITTIVPGAVSAEVYADDTTSSEEMIEQGRKIASWHERVVVKLPTTIEGFKARTVLRKEHILTNNTLVFSQQQIFAICLHEKIIQSANGGTNNGLWPPFISPFVGRLDDQGEDGMMLVENGMQLKELFNNAWMLEASVRRIEYVQRGIDSESELMTAPLKVYKEWFALSSEQHKTLRQSTYFQQLTPIPPWDPSEALLNISSLEEFMKAITTHKLDIRHHLTEKGVARFADDWKAIITV